MIGSNWNDVRTIQAFQYPKNEPKKTKEIEPIEEKDEQYYIEHEGEIFANIVELSKNDDGYPDSKVGFYFHYHEVYTKKLYVEKTIVLKDLLQMLVVRPLYRYMFVSGGYEFTEEDFQKTIGALIFLRVIPTEFIIFAYDRNDVFRLLFKIYSLGPKIMWSEHFSRGSAITNEAVISDIKYGLFAYRRLLRDIETQTENFNDMS